MDTCVNETLPREPVTVKPSRAGLSAAALTFALLATLTGCGGTELSGPTSSEPTQERTSALVSTCGNGKIEEVEQCDDANTTAGDGCSPTCTLEAHANCGNGTIDDFEHCDDGNTTAGDGCSATCTLEAGYNCIANLASPSGPVTCAVTCGDGVKAEAEECDDGNTTSGDGCSSTCVRESAFNCQNTNVSAFFTRRGRSECTKVSNLNSPVGLPEASTQPLLSVPGRYRIQYVSGAASFSNNENWRPGIMGVNYSSATGPQNFSRGYTAGYTTRTEALSQAIRNLPTLRQDFDAITGDVRVAFIDTDCDNGNNSENTITYRVDSVSICQLPPVITDPPSGDTSGATVVGTGTPGATVNVYVGGSTTPSCTAVVDATGRWTCNLVGVTPGTQTITPTSTIVSATVPGNPVTFRYDDTELEAPIITGPPNGSVTSNTTPPISGTSEPGTTVTVREGTTVICTAITNASGAWTCTPTTALAQGPHTVTATATRPSGGDPSPESNSDTFTIDNQPPDTSIDQKPDSSTENTTAEFTYSSNETDVTYECELDGQGWAPCASTYTVTPGQHTLRVRATDKAGNVDPSPAEYTWTVTEPVTEPEPPPEPPAGEPPVFGGGGCSAAPVSSWLALLGLLGLRRRSRR
ncbi:DUF4215 domain-containing protein [Archangium minus]|uniref:DUF4215 domain-containing protein n=1 Tax=Archangium minus TaxID=83450 RepID=A0ABY9X7R8_9BACT|nr:DUF4215 domain-containing protein [Archangium minus]